MASKDIEKGHLTFRAIYCLASDWRMPDDFDLARYPGLLSCRIISGAAGTAQLVTEWASRDLFDSSVKNWFHKDLHLGDPVLVGYEIATYVRGKPFFNASLIPWAITAFTMLMGPLETPPHQTVLSLGARLGKDEA